MKMLQLEVSPQKLGDVGFSVFQKNKAETNENKMIVKIQDK